MGSARDAFGGRGASRVGPVEYAVNQERFTQRLTSSEWGCGYRLGGSWSGMQDWGGGGVAGFAGGFFSDIARLVRSVDTRTGRVVRTYRGTRGSLLRIALSPDGRRVAGAGRGPSGPLVAV